MLWIPARKMTMLNPKLAHADASATAGSAHVVLPSQPSEFVRKPRPLLSRPVVTGPIGLYSHRHARATTAEAWTTGRKKSVRSAVRPFTLAESVTAASRP